MMVSFLLSMLSSCQPSFSCSHSFCYLVVLLSPTLLYTPKKYIFPLSLGTIATFLSTIFHPSKQLSALPVLLLGEPEIQCCTLHVDKQSSWLLPPQRLKVSPPPDWGLEFQLHSWTWVSQLPISLGKGVKKKKIRKITAANKLGLSVA